MISKHFQQNRFWSDHLLGVGRDRRDFGFLPLRPRATTKGNAVPIRKHAFIFQKTCQIEVTGAGVLDRSSYRGRAFTSRRACQGCSRRCPGRAWRSCALSVYVPQFPDRQGPRRCPQAPATQPFSSFGHRFGFFFFFYSLLSF